jgi:hypothetical protein
LDKPVAAGAGEAESVEDESKERKRFFLKKDAKTFLLDWGSWFG